MSQFTLNNIMAGIRRYETGTYEGDYTAVSRLGSGLAVGAYQIMKNRWPYWAAFSGLPQDTPWQNRQAQDFVAGTVLMHMFGRYGNWDLAVAAFGAGTDAADQLADMGYTNAANVPVSEIGDYITGVNNAANQAPATLPNVAPTFRIDASGWIFPVAGPSAPITNSYGYERTEAQLARGAQPIHKGIDIHAAAGTPIVSPSSGTIEAAGWSDVSGNYVILRGQDGYRYFLAHLQETPFVKAGDSVGVGWLLGKVGNTGNARYTEPHLHMEMKDLRTMQHVNPYPWLSATWGIAPTVPSEDPADRKFGATVVADFFDQLAQHIAGSAERVDYRTIGQDVIEEAQAGAVMEELEDKEQIVTAREPIESVDPRVSTGEPGHGGIEA